MATKPAIENASAMETKSYILAKEQAQRTGGGLFVYEPQTGLWVAKFGHWIDVKTKQFVPETYEGSRYTHPEDARRDGKPIFLVADWYAESGISTTGFAEAAADAFFASLVALNQDDAFKNTYMHIIGHSRGTPISSEIAQRLALYDINPKDLRVTLLDPHDFNQPSLNFDKVHNDDFADPDVAYWNTIDFLDSYYQRQAKEDEDIWTFNPNGRSLVDSKQQPKYGPRYDLLDNRELDACGGQVPAKRGQY